jgi:3-phosphoshikimate 1-carboxyvinyltransferase
MTAAVVSTVCREAVTIRGTEAVGKSYPGFFRDFQALGGIYEEV